MVRFLFRSHCARVRLRTLPLSFSIQSESEYCRATIAQAANACQMSSLASWLSRSTGGWWLVVVCERNFGHNAAST